MQGLLAVWATVSQTCHNAAREVDAPPMRSASQPSRCSLVVAGVAVGAGQGADSKGAAAKTGLPQSGKVSKLSITLRIIQGVTVRHPHPPEGDAGDVFSVDLTLFTIKNDFDTAPNTRVGNMHFSYLLHGTCSDAGTGCKGTVDIETTTKLPGGTLTAVAKGTPIRQPFVVAIKSGTGKYKGAKGNIVIAPDGAARTVYNIKLP